MASRSEIPAPVVLANEQWGDAVGKVSPSNGQDGSLCASGKPRKIPVSRAMSQGASAGNCAEVIGPHAAKKSLSPEPPPPVPQTDTGRQGDISSGERATLC